MRTVAAVLLKIAGTSSAAKVAVIVLIVSTGVLLTLRRACERKPVPVRLSVKARPLAVVEGARAVKVGLATGVMITCAVVVASGPLPLLRLKRKVPLMPRRIPGKFTVSNPPSAVPTIVPESVTLLVRFCAVIVRTVFKFVPVKVMEKSSLLTGKVSGVKLLIRGWTDCTGGRTILENTTSGVLLKVALNVALVLKYPPPETVREAAVADSTY